MEQTTKEWKMSVALGNCVSNWMANNDLKKEVSALTILWDKLEGEDRFKYDDYYLSTGRREYPVCKSVEEGLAMPVPEVPDLTQLQNNLIESFPVDLWK